MSKLVFLPFIASFVHLLRGSVCCVQHRIIKEIPSSIEKKEMSARMQVPLTQIRHTNVAVVRYTKHGVRLEIACYKNKVLSYRSGLETRLDEVLQIDRVFTNVGRGSYASSADIHKALGPEFTEATALQYILDHGDLQVAQGERTSEVDEVMKDVVSIIAQKCVHTATKRPFPVHVIEQALRTLGAAVRSDQPAKKQALHFIHQLVESNILPIQRADMKLRVIITDDESNRSASESTSRKVQEWFTAQGAEVVVSEAGDALSFVVLIQPHLFRDAEAFTKGIASCTLNVIETSVAETGEGAASDLEVALQQQVLLAASPGAQLSSSKTCAMPLTKGSSGKKQPGKDGTSSDAGSSSRLSEQPPPQQKHEKNSGRRGGKNGGGVATIEEVAVVSDDDSDGGRKKKAKKPKKVPPPKQQPAKNQANKKGEEDSDDDFVSERKKKKPVVTAQRDDDDEFDYGEED